MAATTEKRYRIQYGNSPAQEVGQTTIDALKKSRLLDRYEVKELTPVPKPRELEEDAEAPEAKAPIAAKSKSKQE